LEFKNCFKHLGIIIDAKLSWNSHIDYILTKSDKLIKSLIGLGKQKYGINPKAMEIIDKGAVLPIISYGVQVWGDAITRKTIVKKLSRLQRRYAIRMIRGYRTISVDAANVLANFVPIDLHLNSIIMEYYIMKNIYHNTLDIFMSNNNINLHSIQRPVSINHLPHPAKRKPILDYITSDHTGNFINIYFNYYKNEFNYISVSFVIYYNQDTLCEQSFKLETYCTLFQSTLFAILRSLEYCALELNCPCIILNICDKSVINSLFDYNSTSYLINSIYKQYYILLDKSINVYINNIDNQFDQVIYAKNVAILAVDSDVINYNLMSKNILKRKLREYMIKIWDFRWQSTEKGPQTKLYFPHIATRLKVKRTFNHDFYVCQALTNHGNNNYYLKRFHLKESQVCDNCGHESDDTNHRIFDCSAYDSQREDLKVAVINENFNWPPPPCAFISYKLFAHFILFCKSIYS